MVGGRLVTQSGIPITRDRSREAAFSEGEPTVHCTHGHLVAVARKF